MSVGNPETPKIDKEQVVAADHPRLVEYIRGAKKAGMSKEQAMKITGAPMEVVDKHYQDKT